MTIIEKSDHFVDGAVAHTQMVRVCAWCPDSKSKTEALIAQGFVVSHTMCKSCESKLLDELGLNEPRVA